MTAVPTNNPVQVLRNAADYLEAHGWFQGEFYAWDGPEPAACALGAIQFAVTGKTVDVFTDDYRTDPATEERFTAVLFAANIVVAYLRQEHDTAWLGSLSRVAALAKWNDRNGRTAAEVVTAMREAADRHAKAGGVR